MAPPPRFAKAHSKLVADLYAHLGWELSCAFRTRESEEPYEYLFAWKRHGEPVWPDWAQFHGAISKSDAPVEDKTRASSP
jgi:hypothetical protein